MHKPPVKTVLFAMNTDAIYAVTNGRVRFCARNGSWISVTNSVPSFAKRLCSVNNFKERK